MIKVTRKEGDTNTKLVSLFQKRVKKYNLMARVRKTLRYKKRTTDRVIKQKALSTVKWQKENEFANLAKF